MRKLNVKLFLVLVIGAAVAAGSVWGLHTFQYQRIAAALLWQARRAEEASKFDQMARYLDRYLEFAPQDLEEQAHLGRALAGEHFAGSLTARRQAFFVLNKVLTKDSNRPDLQRLLVKTALEIGEYSAARHNLESLAKDAGFVADQAARGEMEGYWGRLLEVEKNPVESMKYCRLAVKDVPADEGSYARLAWLLRAQAGTADQQAKNYEEADRVVNDLVANNQASAKAHLTRWRYRREFDLLDVRGRKEATKIPLEKAAAEDVDVALAQAPEDVDALIAKADCELLQRHSGKAYDYLQQGLKLQTTIGYHSASDMAEFQLLWHLASLLLDDPKLSADENKVLEVEQTIARIRKTRGQPAAADYLEGRLCIHKKEWARAVALLERARPALSAQQVSPDLIGQIDLCLGLRFEALEEPAQAAAAFRHALEWDPNLPQAHRGLGDALRMLGRLDEALEHLSTAAAAGQDPGKNWLEVGRMEILRQLQHDQRVWTAAEDAIDRAAQAIPNNAKEAAQPALLRAEILAIQNRWDEAEKLLTDARTAHPELVEFWTALADIAGRRKDEAKALAILDEAEKTLHDNVDLRISRSLHLVADPTEAHLAALADLTKKDRSGFTAEDQERLVGGLALAQTRAGRPAEAAALLEELARMPDHRTDLRLRLTLFDLAVKQNKPDDMDKVLAEIREIEGGPGAFYGLGEALRSLYLARKTPENARQALDDAWRALDRAAALQPRWSAVELARADVAELSGDPEGMIAHLKEAAHIEQGRTNPLVIQRLVEALNQRGRYSEAAENIKPLQQSLLVNSPLGRLAAGVALNTGDMDGAKKLIEAAAESKNFRDILLRARFHEATKQDREAEEEYRKATEAAPEEPAAWVAYVQFLGNHDRNAQAEALIKSDVAVKVPKEKAALAVAECYEVLALRKDANESYDAAVTARADDPVVVRAVAAYRLRSGRVQEATPLLERLAGREVKDASPADVDWARRGLAMVLSSGTDYRDFRRALELVGLQLDDNGMLARQPDAGREESLEIRRAKARVLASQPQRQFRTRAIQLLEGLQPPDNDDQYLLALLYDADGAQDKEAEILKRLATGDDRTIKPAHLAQYAQVLLRQGKSDKSKLDEALALVVRLEKLETDRGLPKGAFATVDLRARLLEAQGQGDKALDLIREHVNRRGAAKEEVLQLVASLGRQKRFAEAFDLCEKEKIWEKCPPQMAGGVCVALLRAMPQADEQRNRVEGWLNKAVKEHPELVVLKMHLADLADLRGDYKGAEAEYREILRQEPGNVVALNNLAWLLSRQTGQGAEALKYIDAAVNGVGRRADLLDTRGMVELTLGNTDAALADFMDASTDSPTAARLYHLARAQYLARDRDAAMRTLARARSDYGLQPGGLHPAEQQECQTMLSELKVR